MEGKEVGGAGGCKVEWGESRKFKVKRWGEQEVTM